MTLDIFKAHNTLMYAGLAKYMCHFLFGIVMIKNRVSTFQQLIPMLLLLFCTSNSNYFLHLWPCYDYSVAGVFVFVLFYFVLFCV